MCTVISIIDGQKLSWMPLTFSIMILEKTSKQYGWTGSCHPKAAGRVCDRGCRLNYSNVRHFHCVITKELWPEAARWWNKSGFTCIRVGKLYLLYRIWQIYLTCTCILIKPLEQNTVVQDYKSKFFIIKSSIYLTVPLHAYFSMLCRKEI